MKNNESYENMNKLIKDNSSIFFEDIDNTNKFN